jgi:hypothetical protein
MSTFSLSSVEARRPIRKPVSMTIQAAAVLVVLISAVLVEVAIQAYVDPEFLIDNAAWLQSP